MLVSPLESANVVSHRAKPPSVVDWRQRDRRTLGPERAVGRKHVTVRMKGVQIADGSREKDQLCSANNQSRDRCHE